MGSELVDLDLNRTLAGELFTLSRKWLILGGEVPLQSAR